VLKLTHNLKPKFGDTPVVGEDVVVILKKGGMDAAGGRADKQIYLTRRLCHISKTPRTDKIRLNQDFMLISKKKDVHRGP